MVSLRRMSQAEYDAYYPGSLQSLADELARAYDLDPEDGLKEARKSFASLLPDGKVDVPDQYLYAIEADQVKVGVLWFCVRRARKVPEAYVLDVVVDEPHRRRGYAREAMVEMERLLRALGVTRVALNVFEHNRGAQQLYARLGYDVSAHALLKRLR